jgi:phosphopantothenoylcysteine synthetase/decarboxylase
MSSSTSACSDTAADQPLTGRLLIGATGSATVVALPSYLSALRIRFSGTVTVFMTHTAATFLPASTAALFADRVVTGDDPAGWPKDNHASLAAGHDLLAVLPATANILAETATGAASNLLSATILATAIPVVFFPVMSAEMWQKPAVQRNVAQIRHDGHHVIDPPWGPRYDISLGEFVGGPLPPAPPRFLEVIEQLMPKP